MTNNPTPPGPAPQLADLRDEIDALDDELLALIERRLAVAMKVATLKGSDGQLRLRPKRERAIVERLASRATIATPALIGHVWREMMAHSLQTQARTEVALHAPTAHAELREQARMRFGLATPIVEAGSVEAALQAATEREAIAVIELGGEETAAALTERPALHLFGTLTGGGATALIVGRIAEADIPDVDRVAVDEALRRAREQGR